VRRPALLAALLGAGGGELEPQIGAGGEPHAAEQVQAWDRSLDAPVGRRPPPPCLPRRSEAAVRRPVERGAGGVRARQGRESTVHGGYTLSRQVRKRRGHERSRAVTRNRRSARRFIHDQAASEAAGQSSSLPTLAAASPPDPCPRGGGHRGRSSPSVEVEPTAPRLPGFLTGRATRVPFTTDMTGPLRTATDNAKAASTCPVDNLGR
jgi:hypothetical protein